MGCDIHVMVEQKRTINKTEKWVNVDNWRYNPYFGTDENEPVMHLHSLYWRRNYELFSFLANVRNYGKNPSFGFDRGIPKDASRITVSEYNSWGNDAHTPGYATLAELKEKIATVGKIKRKGFVHVDEIKRYIAAKIPPTEWYQGVSGPSANQYAWFEWEVEVNCFNELIAAIEERKREVFWIFSAEDDDGSRDNDIRIIFWFDN